MSDGTNDQVPDDGTGDHVRGGAPDDWEHVPGGPSGTATAPTAPTDRTGRAVPPRARHGRTRRVVLMAVAVVAVLGLAAAGAMAFGFFRSVQDRAARLVPEDAPIYASAYVDPSGSQKLALRDLITRFPKVGVEEGDDPIHALGRRLDEQFGEIDLDYTEDVQPWLDRQMAFFLAAPEDDPSGDAGDDAASPASDGGDINVPGIPTAAFVSPDAAVLVGTTDAEATLDAVDAVLVSQNLSDAPEERRHAGVTYRVIAAEELSSADVPGQQVPGSRSPLEIALRSDAAYGVVGDFLVVGTEPAVRDVIDTSRGTGSLAGNDRFREATGGLTQDHLVSYYVDTSGLFETIRSRMPDEQRQTLDTFGFAEQGPAAGAVYAREDGVVFEASSRLPEDGGGAGTFNFARVASGSSIERVPADAWLAFGLPDLGELGQSYLELFQNMVDATAQSFGATADERGEATGGQVRDLAAEFKRATGLDLREDVLRWMDTARVFATGGDPASIRGALAIDASDAAGAEAFLDEIERLVNEQGLSTTPIEVEGLSGFAAQAPGMPVRLIAVAGETFVIGVGEDAVTQAVAPERPLTDNQDFADAVEGLAGMDTSFYLDLDAVVGFVESALGGFGGGLPSTYREDVKPYVDVLDAVVAGAETQDRRITQRVFIQVGESGDQQASGGSNF